MNNGDNPTHLEEESGNGAESYFVSLTDLMTGVVFIFVILLASYIVVSHEARRDLQKEKRANEIQRAELEEEKKANQQKAKELEDQNRKIKEKEEELEAKGRENQDQAKKIDRLAEILRDRENTRRKMLDDVVVRLKQKGVTVILDANNGIIRLPEDLLFDSGKAELRAGGRRVLEILGKELIAMIDTIFLN